MIFPPSTDKVTVTGPCIPVEEPVKVFPEAFAVEPAELAHPASIKDAAKSAVKDFFIIFPPLSRNVLYSISCLLVNIFTIKNQIWNFVPNLLNEQKNSLQIYNSHLTDSGSISTGCSLRSSHNVKEKYLYAS